MSEVNTKRKVVYVIADSALPSRPPTILTVVWYLLMDHTQAPSWLWGALGMVMGLIWISWISRALREKSRELPGFGEAEE